MWFILYGFCLLSIRCDQRWQRIAERDGMTKGKQTDDIICPFVFWYSFAILFSIYISFHYNKNEYKFQYNYKISIFSSSGRETSSRKLSRYKEIEWSQKLSSKHFLQSIWYPSGFLLRSHPSTILCHPFWVSPQEKKIKLLTYVFF